MGARISSKRRNSPHDASRPLSFKEQILLGEFSVEELLHGLDLAGEVIKQFDDKGTLATRTNAFTGDSELLDLMATEGPTELIARLTAEAASRMLQFHTQPQEAGRETLIRDAGEVASFALAIDRCLEQDPIHGGKLLDLAVKLGMAYQLMLVRDAEAHVKRGVKTKQSARSAHIKAHGTDKQKRERWQKMAKRFQELLDEGDSKMTAYRKVAKEHKCNSRTVQSAVSKMSRGG